VLKRALAGGRTATWSCSPKYQPKIAEVCTQGASGGWRVTATTVREANTEN
jgi:hypothetical protein